MKYKTVIIGAGPTGLGTAYRLKEIGEDDFIVLEKSDRVGGLSASFVDKEGFTWDIGGHVQFSHYKYFDNLMEKALGDDGWLNHERESWIWIKNRFVPYPFQNNIRYLPRDSMWKCLKGIIHANKNEKTGSKTNPQNFKEWIIKIFGQGIAEEFMFPYNYKVWGYPAEELSYKWIGERVAVTELEWVIENILFEKDDISWGPNNTFQFPKFGGTGAIWKGVASLVGLEKFLHHAEVVTIDSRKKILTLKDGRKIEYENLLSTMPVDILTSIASCFHPN
jgi:protoporphyrinogen oxidase